MIDYGIDIRLTGDVPEKLRRISDTLNDVKATANEAGRTVKSQFGETIRTQQQVVEGLSARYKELAAAAKEASWNPNLQAAADQAKTALESEKGALRELIEARRLYQQQNAQIHSGMYGLTRTLRGVIGLYTLGTSAVGAFTQDSEKLVRIQQRLVQSLSALASIESVVETIRRLHVRQTGFLTTATRAWHTVQTAMTRALWGSTAAATALMGVLTLGLSVAITAAIAGISKYVQKRKEEAAAVKAAREAEEQFNKSIAQNAAQTMTQFKLLQNQWQQTNGDIVKQTAFINDNQKAFKDLGLAINSARDCEDAFVRNAGNFEQSIMRRAKAMAAQTKLTELYGESIEHELVATEAGEAIKRASGVVSVYQNSVTKQIADWAERATADALKTAVKQGYAITSYTAGGGVSMQGTVGTTRLTDQEKAYLTAKAALKENEPLLAANQSKIDEIAKEVGKYTKVVSANSEQEREASTATTYKPSSTTDATSGVRGVSGSGGVRNFEITFNAPVVTVDDNHLEGTKYSPEEIGKMAAKEVMNILTQLAVS